MPASSSRMGSNRSMIGSVTKMPKKPIKVKLVSDLGPRVEGRSVPKKKKGSS